MENLLTKAIFVSRKMGLLHKDEYILDEEFLDFQQAYQHLRHVLDWAYNHQRPHSSLGYLTPTEFEAQYLPHLSPKKSGKGGGINTISKPNR